MAVPFRSRIAPAGGPWFAPGSALTCWGVWAEPEKTMSTVQQRSVKATFFKVVRVVRGIKSLSIGNALFCVFTARRFAIMADSLLGFRPKAARNGNLEISKVKLGNGVPVPHFLFRG